METQNQKKIKIITIDGPAGSGKSTIAKMLAKHIDFIHIDSGAIYRGYTYAVIQKIGLQASAEDFGNTFQTLNILPHEFSLKIEFFQEEQIVLLNGVPINSYLRTRELTERIKFIADSIPYRKAVNSILKEISKNHSIVIDGRDMGTEVFPEAKFKFYLEASIEERAKRRFLEIQNKAPNISLELIKKEIQKRDEEDKNRNLGGLKIPKDSIIIDTTSLNRNMVLNLIKNILNFSF
ncbi:MAG: (d)CMP kinase [Leptonema sp. (in: bacteria)]